MPPTATAPASRLFSLFPHERGPADPYRTIALGELREWPDLWKADPRLLSAIGDGELEALVRGSPGRLRYFSATDPAYPGVPLLRADLAAVPDARTPATGIRDKVWQRLAVEEIG